MTWVPSWLPWHGGSTYRIRSVRVAWVADGEFVVFWTGSDGRTDDDGNLWGSTLFSQRGTVTIAGPPVVEDEIVVLADYDRPMSISEVERTESGRFALRLYSPSEH